MSPLLWLPPSRGPLTGCGCAFPLSVYPRLSVTVPEVAFPLFTLAASALAGVLLVAGLAAVAVAGLAAVAFVAGCLVLEEVAAGRAVALVAGLLVEVVAGTVCLLVEGVAVAGRVVVLLFVAAGREVVVGRRLVVVAGRLAAEALC